jgi:hypothetical protein
MAAFYDYEPERAPPWLRGPKGTDFLRARGDVKDALARNIVAGVEQRFPSLASADALATLAEERGLARGPNESLEVWATKVRRAWEIWRESGTARGLLRALRDSGFPEARLSIARGKEYGLSNDVLSTRDLPGGAFLMRLEQGWAEFIVILERLHPLRYLAGTVTSTTGWGGVVQVLGTGDQAYPDVRIVMYREGFVSDDPEDQALILFSLNGGLSWEGTACTTAPVPLATSGLSLQFAPGGYIEQDADWAFSVAVDPLPVPLTAEEEAVIGLQARTFKPAFARYAGVVVLQRGQTLNYAAGAERTMDDWGIPYLDYSEATFYPTSEA